MAAPMPDYPQSKLIHTIILEKFRFHIMGGDMWPTTWADDGNLYTAAGDNSGSPTNIWRVNGNPLHGHHSLAFYNIYMELINNKPVDPGKYCPQRPYLHPNGVKASSLIALDGTLYMAVELHNYGENSKLNRQRNYHSWIITSNDYGKTWNTEATPVEFFNGRLSSPKFLQFGRNYENARDEYVYANFPAGDDGGSYWENADYTLLGRVKKGSLLDRAAWDFYAGLDGGKPQWSSDDNQATHVFRYPSMTGANHVAYNKGIKRYIMGNYGFLDGEGNPRPLHQGPLLESAMRSQLTLFEAPEPWGPWSLFYHDNDWGTYGDYQPSFPTKWMSDDGRIMWMVSAGTFDDYNFVMQMMTLVIY